MTLIIYEPPGIFEPSQVWEGYIVSLSGRKHLKQRQWARDQLQRIREREASGLIPNLRQAYLPPEKLKK